MPPLAFEIKLGAVVMQGVVGAKRNLCWVNNGNPFEVCQEDGFPVFHEGRDSNAMQGLVAKVVDFDLFHHPFFVADDNAHAGGKFNIVGSLVHGKKNNKRKEETAAIELRRELVTPK